MSMNRVLGIAAVGMALFAQVALAGSAELRYIRMGEHHDYTRVVFEFTRLPDFANPVLSGKEEASVVFSNTSTVLPAEIPGETTERIDYVKFHKKGKNLIASLRLSVPRPNLNSFSLSDPPRIVVDIRPLNPPVEGPGGNGPSATAEPARPQGTSSGKATPRPSADAVESIRVPGPRRASLSPTPPSVSPAEKAANIGSGQKGKKEQPQIDMQADTVGVPSAENMQEESLPSSTSGGMELQVYLLSALTVLSALIVVLLTALVCKRRTTTSGKGLAESDRATGEKIARLDNRIETELEKLDTR